MMKLVMVPLFHLSFVFLVFFIYSFCFLVSRSAISPVSFRACTPLNETSSHPRGRKEANLKKLVTLTLRPLSLPINTHDFKTL